MSLFSRSTKVGSVLLAGLFLLTGCTLRPVYQDEQRGEQKVSYSAPATVTEQTIIQELAFKLGRSASPSYKLTLSATTKTRSIFGVGSEFVQSEHEATVRASFVLMSINGGEQILKGERFASAIYQANGQIGADKAAQTDAYQRAAKDVARQIELLIAKAIDEDQP